MFKDRGSKFISYAFPAESEAEIKALLENVRKAHHGANQVCYAWRLGANKEAHRSSDDGEPANTAGKPIFGQIQFNDLPTCSLWCYAISAARCWERAD